MRILGVCVLVVAVGCGPKQVDRDGDGPDAGPEMVCAPGAIEACYNGPQGTENVGTCASGTRTCNDLGQWSVCNGEILPAGEICGNALDDNCSGVADEDEDLDAD